MHTIRIGDDVPKIIVQIAHLVKNESDEDVIYPRLLVLAGELFNLYFTLEDTTAWYIENEMFTPNVDLVLGSIITMLEPNFEVPSTPTTVDEFVDLMLEIKGPNITLSEFVHRGISISSHDRL